MNTINLDINGQSVTLKFGYGLFRLLGEVWNVPGINGVMQRLAIFEQMDGTDITFEQMDILSDFVVNSARVGNSDVKIDPNDVVDYFMSDPKKIMEVMTVFIASIPQPKPMPDNLGKLKKPLDAQNKKK